MPKTEVTDALTTYLAPEQSGITYLGSVYSALPKVSNESDLFNFVPPGTGVGALIYLFCESQEEVRIAMAGAHGGRKFRTYGFSMLCIFKSDLPTSTAGQAAFNTFIDSLTAYIQADRNAGTEAIAGGGFGPWGASGYIFQWGEGGISGPGADIRIEYPVPKTAEGGVTLFYGILRVTVCETLVT